MTHQDTQTLSSIRKSTVAFAEAGVLNNLVSDYLDTSPEVSGYYKVPFSLEGILNSIPSRSFSPALRKQLAGVLRRQYKCLSGDVTDEVNTNIDRLEKEGTYTVTTGHQLNIFTGPLYFLYKLASTINLAQSLKEAKPGCDFVPVYWMASEDHDFAEINHANLYGQKVEWNSGQGGAAGRMACMGFREIIAALEQVMDKTPQAAQVLDLARKAYVDGKSLSEATRIFVHGLFGKYGLLILDPDDAELKKSFAPVMADDAINHAAFRKVSETLKSIEPRYKAQVHPREINLFWLDRNLRSRIEKQGDKFAVLGQDRFFTSSEIDSEIRRSPEHFSPNVVLRPMYQESVLPNLAVIGGPAEISYWLEYKSMFDHYGVSFPCLVLRGMALLLDRPLQARMEKLGLGDKDLFTPADELVKKYVSRQGDTGFIEKARQKLNSLFDEIAAGIGVIDSTLTASAEGERQKGLKSVQLLEDKALKALKRKNETAVAQIEKIKTSLFPGGVLQERIENFLPFYARLGQEFIDFLVNEMNPLQKTFFVFSE